MILAILLTVVLSFVAFNGHWSMNAPSIFYSRREAKRDRNWAIFCLYLVLVVEWSKFLFLY